MKSKKLKHQTAPPDKLPEKRDSNDSVGLNEGRDTNIKESDRLMAPARDIFNPIPHSASLIQTSLTTIFDMQMSAMQNNGMGTTNGSVQRSPGSGIAPIASPIFRGFSVSQSSRGYTPALNAIIRAIETKASQLGWVGAIIADLADVEPGSVIRYEHADIYYSRETGAHEVHGDIRAKYNFLGGADGVLGLPVTDEIITPDGIGRFNHFQGGSIYWTPNTGPMMVRGAIRDLWAKGGWELGMGYPVSDPQRKISYDIDAGNHDDYLSKFQRGAIYAQGNAAAEALIVELLPHQLAAIIRKKFDEAFKEANKDLGIEGGVNILNVSNWGYGFTESQKRTITYEINGFYSNGFPLVADPTFRLEIQFIYSWTWKRPPGLPPGFFFGANDDSTDKLFVIHLGRSSYISTSGVGHGTLLEELNSKISGKFPFVVEEISHEAKMRDILVTPQGGLQFLLEPNLTTPEIGRLRQQIFINSLNLMLENL